MESKGADETQELEDTDVQWGKLMASIGANGYYQKRHNIIFNFFMVMFISMTYMNMFIMMTVPKHHCHIPGRNASLYTINEWHELKLPKENDTSTGEETLSSCKMYSEINETQDCPSGWDYDKTWFSETLPSSNDWVCDQELNIANAYTTWFIGEIIGVLTLGQLGDRLGRKPVYFIAVGLLVISRFIMLMASHIFYVFAAAMAIGGLSSTSVFQTPLVIALEISTGKVQSKIAFLQCCGYAIGNSLMPLLAWALGDWRYIMLATVIPSTTVFFFYNLLPESPRWLATTGKVEEAVEILKKISVTNKTLLPTDASVVLNKIAARKEKTYGMASLFTSFLLAKNTLMFVICWAACGLASYSILLNISNLDGNPFMNFFWQAITDIPGFALGQYLCVAVGRRWPLAVCFFLIMPLAAVTILANGIYAWLTTVCISGIKLFICATQYILWLMTIEMYPTCIRQTGSSVGLLTGNSISLLGPYVVYLGTSVDSRLPHVVIFCLALMATIASLMLPETFKQKLPETLDEARLFGKNHKIWSMNRAKSERMIEKEKQLIMT